MSGLITDNGYKGYFSYFSSKLSSIPIPSWSMLGSTFQILKSNLPFNSTHKIEKSSDITSQVKVTHAISAIRQTIQKKSLQSGERSLSFKMKCFAIFAFANTFFQNVLCDSMGRVGNLDLTEENFFSLTKVTSDIFGSIPGGISVINGTSLSSGLSISNAQTYITNSLAIQQLGLITNVNGYILASTNYQNLQVISTKNNSPAVIGIIQTSSPVVDLACTVAVCYALTNGLQIIDVTNLPNSHTINFNPLIKGTKIAISRSGKVGAIYNGNINNAPNFFIINLNDKSNPKIVDSILLKTVFNVFDFGSFDLDDNFCCVTNTLGSLLIYDTRNISSGVKGIAPIQDVMQQGFKSVTDVIKNRHSCVVNAFNNGLQNFNITTPSNMTITSIVGTGNNFQSMNNFGDYYYAAAFNQLFEINLSDDQNPVMVSTANLPINPNYKQIAVTNQNIYFGDGSFGLRTTTRGQTFTIDGTPAGGTKGNYTITLVGLDINGTSIHRDVTFDATIKPAVLVNGQVAEQLAVVGSSFNFYIPPTSFKQINGNGLTYSATLNNGSPLPYWIKFNSISAAFTGTVPANTTGNFEIRVRATDSLDAYNDIHFNFKSIFGPTVSYQLPTQVVQLGTRLNYPLPSDFIIDKDGEQFEMVVSSQSGPFPSWLTYNSTSHTFTGTPVSSSDVGNTNVVIKATAVETGVSIEANFQIQAVLPGTPILQNLIPDYQVATGDTLVIPIPRNTFTSPFGEELEYTITGYPSWMKLNKETLTLSGEPSTFDVGETKNNEYKVLVKVNGKVASNSYSFTITVKGTPILIAVSQVMSAAASVIGLCVGMYAYRVKLWNACCKRRYVKVDRHVNVGEIFTYQIKNAKPTETRKPYALLPRDPITFTIKGRTFKWPKALTPKRDQEVLPDFLHHIVVGGNYIKSDPIPADQENQRYKMFIKRNDGRILERFNLIIWPPKPRSLSMPNQVVPIEANNHEEIYNEDDDPVANYVDQRLGQIEQNLRQRKNVENDYLKVPLLQQDDSDNYKAKAPPSKNLVEEEHKENSWLNNKPPATPKKPVNSTVTTQRQVSPLAYESHNTYGSTNGIQLENIV